MDEYIQTNEYMQQVDWIAQKYERKKQMAEKIHLYMKSLCKFKKIIQLHIGF